MGCGAELGAGSLERLVGAPGLGSSKGPGVGRYCVHPWGTSVGCPGEGGGYPTRPPHLGGVWQVEGDRPPQGSQVAMTCREQGLAEQQCQADAQPRGEVTSNMDFVYCAQDPHTTLTAGQGQRLITLLSTWSLSGRVLPARTTGAPHGQATTTNFLQSTFPCPWGGGVLPGCSPPLCTA